MIVTNCDRCGACCLEQTTPPGYVALLADLWPVAEDHARLRGMPAEALQAIKDRMQTADVEQPCCWLDLETMRCRWYEHRPLACRELEVGGEECIWWRNEYGVTTDDD